jgi:hypothetical protein
MLGVISLRRSLLPSSTSSEVKELLKGERAKAIRALFSEEKGYSFLDRTSMHGKSTEFSESQELLYPGIGRDRL